MSIPETKKTYDNSNRGALFRNDRKEEGSKQPDYKGRINTAGVDYELSAWLKESAEGKKFFSLSVRSANEQTAPKPAPKPPAFGDDVPF